MPERKPWTSDEDEALKEIVSTGVSKWTIVAKTLETKYEIFGRTGKQCRQRWFNQLNPQISNSIWSFEQQNLLYQLHNQLGNSWSKISQQLKGRTDNQIKNHFYSTIRKAFRRLNRHISTIKSKKQLSTVVLTKLLAASEDKFDNKLKLTEQVQQMSIKIKNDLLQLAGDIDENKEDINEMNEIIKDLIAFSKTWKRKKKASTKRKDRIIEQDQQSMSYDQSSVQQAKNIETKNNTKIKKNQNNGSKIENSNLKSKQDFKQQQSFDGMRLRSSRAKSQSNSNSMINGVEPVPLSPSLNRLSCSAFSIHSRQQSDEIIPLRKRSSSRSSHSFFGSNARQRYSDFDYLPRAAGFSLIQSHNLNTLNMFEYPPQSLLERLDD